MSPEQWKEIERIYLEALERPPAEREEFARVESREDDEVLKEVLRLLRSDPPSSAFMEPPSSHTHDEVVSVPKQLGEFELLEEVGRGSMGVVFRAIQQPLGRVVAVKVLPPSLVLTQRKIDRFVREARAAAKLQHPHIVPVLTVGEDQGIRYFAMEYVDGHNVAVELKRLHKALKSQRVEPSHLPDSRSQEYFRSVVRLIRDAADALEHAHRNGIIHRDIKPSNLQLDVHGSVHVVDFGLAHDEGQETLTRSGDVAGTPHYMSPEQARAHRNEIDHRTDVYSLGVVLYELLTLRRPYGGRSSTEILNNILQTDPPRVRNANPRVPRDLETICEAAMAKDPDDRYAGAAQLRDDLDRFLSLQAIQARPMSGLRRALRLARRRARWIGVGAAILLALALGAWWSARAARLDRIDGFLAQVREVQELDELESLSLSRQIELRAILRALSSSGVRAASEDDPVTVLEQLFDEYRVALTTSGRSDLDASRDGTLDEGAREMRRLRGLQTLLLASRLYPEDRVLQALASIEAAFPRLSVNAADTRGSDVGADVFLREIDPLTTQVGAKRPLGRAPLSKTPIEPGYYRVIVVFEEGGFRELPITPGPAFMDIELLAVRRDDEDVVSANMVSFAGASYTFSDYPSEACFQGKTVELQSFLMDEHEVSNAEYFEFMNATGTQPPKFWRMHVPDIEAFVRQYPDRPAVSMTWPEAAAFAAWRGKRLPSMGEWHRAASGLENRPWPFAADPGSEVLGNVHAPWRTGDGAQRWRNYVEFSSDIKSHPEARTPEGLYHMYGNVFEWTEGVAASLTPTGELTPRPHSRFITGGGWDALAREESLKTAILGGIGPNFTMEHIGFRCAKSVAP